MPIYHFADGEKLCPGKYCLRESLSFGNRALPDGCAIDSAGGTECTLCNIFAALSAVAEFMGACLVYRVRIRFPALPASTLQCW